MSYLRQYEYYQPPPPEVPWWKQLWRGTKEVLTTGAEVFEKVGPSIFDKPRIYPRVEQRHPTDILYTPGQRIQPGRIIVTLPSGQRVVRRTQGTGVMPEWFLPVAFLAGGILLTTMKPRKR